MNKLLCALFLMLAVNTANAQAVITLPAVVIPTAITTAIEKIYQIFDEIRTVAEPENKDWAKYTSMKNKMINQGYITGRKVALNGFTTCVGENPTSEQSTSCSESYSSMLQILNQQRKDALQHLSEENKKHRMYLVKKREFQTQVDAILE